ncbi:hypothetical protein [Streptomyces sp. NPDC057554]|uniref:hypothetical protein n=1 Tax=Streptomyces sp. NPDC057554 TaxID=3350538 RepID=UPI003677D3B3
MNPSALGLRSAGDPIALRTCGWPLPPQPASGSPVPVSLITQAGYHLPVLWSWAAARPH